MGVYGIGDNEELIGKTIRGRRDEVFLATKFGNVQVLVERVREFAAGRGVKPGQMALAWVLAKGEDVVPIPGTKRRTYLEENAAAADIKLTPAEVAELEDAVPESAVVGDRYEASSMRSIDR